MWVRNRILGTIAACAATVGLAASGPASAQDWNYAQPTGWTGLYAGVNLGYAWGDSRHTDTFGATSGDFDVDGFTGGGTLGYNWQSSQLVFGVETDISGGSIDGGTQNACGAPGCISSVDWLWTVRGRLGWDMNGIMPYLTAGLAVGGVDASTSGLASASDTLAGYTLGGGIEMKLGSNWSLKGEYLYTDLGDVSVPTPAPTTADFDSIHTVRAGLNYRF